MENPRLIRICLGTSRAGHGTAEYAEWNYATEDYDKAMEAPEALAAITTGGATFVIVCDDPTDRFTHWESRDPHTLKRI